MFDWKSQSFPGYRPVHEPWNTKIVDVHWKKGEPFQQYDYYYPVFPVGVGGLYQWGWRHIFQAYNLDGQPIAQDPSDEGQIISWWIEFTTGVYGLLTYDPPTYAPFPLPPPPVPDTHYFLGISTREHPFAFINDPMSPFFVGTTTMSVVGGISYSPYPYDVPFRVPKGQDPALFIPPPPGPRIGPFDPGEEAGGPPPGPATPIPPDEQP